MAKRNGNGHANGKDPVVTAIHELTAQVVERLSALEAGQAAIEQVLRGHGKQVAELRAELHDGLGKVNDRLDNIRDFAGERYRE